MAFDICQKKIGVLERLPWEIGLSLNECLVKLGLLHRMSSADCDLLSLAAAAPDEGVFRMYRARHHEILARAALQLGLLQTAENRYRTALDLYESINFPTTSERPISQTWVDRLV